LTPSTRPEKKLKTRVQEREQECGNEERLNSDRRHPDPATLGKIREFIVKHPARWKKAINDPRFQRHWTLEGERLSRPPRGYDPDHPLIGDLKRKDFTAFRNLGEADACAPVFLDRYAQACAAAAPLMRFLTTAVDLQF